MNNAETFFVGTYSTSGPYVPEAKGEGILSCNLDLGTGEIKRTRLFREKINATYLAKNDSEQLFAACDNFGETGEVRAFYINEDSSLGLLSSRSTHGSSSCHVAYYPPTKRILISSYANGILSSHVFDGASIDPEPELLNYIGSGPSSLRQEASHIHQAVVSTNKKWLYACDLGSDKIWLHDLMNKNLQVKTGIPTPAGSGPRHLVCHPYLSLVFVFCELDAKVLTFHSDPASGLLNLISTSDTLPQNFTGEPAGAAIRMHPTAKTLYVSNRNHNSLTVFSLTETGQLKYKSNFHSGGKEPRDFNIDPSGQWLLIANQNSNSIVPFKLDPASGLPTGKRGPEYKCGTPVCILFKNNG